MPLKPKRAPATTPDVDDVLAVLRAHANDKTLKEMGPRYGIVSDRALGVPMAKIQLVAKALGRDHALAGSLWATGWYEARLLASLVADPALLTPAVMDRWCRDFDNWAVVDTVCFKLFDRSPHALAMVRKWSAAKGEFQRRAAYALLACMALHGHPKDDATYLSCLPLVEAAGTDDRNFVRKSVSWALRAIGGRSPALHLAVRELAGRLIDGGDPTARSIGREALRDLAKSSPAVTRKEKR